MSVAMPSGGRAARTAAAGAALPLVVDLDGTLLRGDMLVETASALACARPGAALWALLALRQGRAALKHRLALLAMPDLATLPWNQEVLIFLRAQRAAGRALYLASAADRCVVDAVSAHFPGLFDGVFASDGRINRKGAAKAAPLAAAFPGGFAYAGNERADLAVWRVAAERLVVNASIATLRAARSIDPAAKVLSSPPPLRAGTVLRALRPHQWLKNLLVFLPALAAHRWDVAAMSACVLAFASLALAASSIYLANDLLDLAADRAHPAKRRRPLASGAMPPRAALRLVPGLLAASVMLALPLSAAFLPVLAGYVVLATAYSCLLKRRMMLDVVTLACLYGLRLGAGAVATATPLSPWMVAFALFLFTALALVKRCTELAGRSASGTGDPPGRAYRLADLPVLRQMAAASSFTAVLVLALYVNSPDTAGLYAHPARLWLLATVLIFWLGRVLLLTGRGEMHDDPVVFALTDRASLACAVLGAIVILAASL